MCCRDCCTCDCCDNNEDKALSLPEFLDSNDHPDSTKLSNFLDFVRGYIDPVVNDPSWYTQERFISLYKSLRLP